jgi:hypothetical protein
VERGRLVAIAVSAVLLIGGGIIVLPNGISPFEEGYGMILPALLVAYAVTVCIGVVAVLTAMLHTGPEAKEVGDYAELSLAYLTAVATYQALSTLLPFVPQLADSGILTAWGGLVPVFVVAAALYRVILLRLLNTVYTKYSRNRVGDSS